MKLDKSVVRFIPSLIVILMVLLMDVPSGIEVNVWHTFAFFLGFILACLFSAGSIGFLVLLLLTAILVSNTMPIDELLSGYGNPAVWLVLFAFFSAIGFRNTHLGQRIAYHFIAKMGHHPIMLVYAISFCDFIIAPFLPNANARGAGILFPITKALAESLGSSPENSSQKKIGSYLFMASFQLNLIIGAVFLTAMSTNPLAAEMLKESFHIDITWMKWFFYASVPMILTLLVVPWVIYFLNKPTMTQEEMQAAPAFARQELTARGKISIKEWIMLGIFLCMIVLWGLGSLIKLHATVVALLGVVAMLCANIISYKDIIEERTAWDILIWLAPLIAITGFLSKNGMMVWLVERIQAPFFEQSFLLVYVISVLLYFYIHYFLTSLFVHLQAFFLPFVTLLIAMGGNPYIIGMVFALLTCVSPGTTHYGTGTASIYYSSGYLTQKEWWKTGFIVSVAEIILIAGVGYGWMMLIS